MDLSAISQKILSTQYLLLSTTGEKTPPAKNGLHLFLNWAKWPCIPYITSLIYHPCFFLGGGKTHLKKTCVLCFFWFKFVPLLFLSKPQVLLPPWSGIFYDEVSRVIWSLHCMRRDRRRACSWGPYFWDFPVKPGRPQRAPQGQPF